MCKTSSRAAYLVPAYHLHGNCMRIINNQARCCHQHARKWRVGARGQNYYGQNQIVEEVVASTNCSKKEFCCNYCGPNMQKVITMYSAKSILTMCHSSLQSVTTPGDQSRSRSGLRSTAFDSASKLSSAALATLTRHDLRALDPRWLRKHIGTFSLEQSFYQHAGRGQ